MLQFTLRQPLPAATEFLLLKPLSAAVAPVRYQYLFTGRYCLRLSVQLWLLPALAPAP